MDILFVFMVSIVIGAFWAMYCTKQTFADIHAMRCCYYITLSENVIPNDLRDMFKREEGRVRHETHIWYRMTFRDWKTLYPKFFGFFKDTK